MAMLLRVEALSKVFKRYIPSSVEISGCIDVSFDVEEGEFLGILGPSGSGKSTILKCIYRTYLPTSGNILYNSKLYGIVNIAKAPEQVILRLRLSEISYVSQFLKVIPRVSTLNLVANALLSRRKVPEVEAIKKAKDILERLGVPSKLFDAFPSTFSGGEQQKVNIAMAVVWKPRLLLLDEPTASLDMHSANQVLDLLKELKQQGTTMIGVFHDIELMKLIADRTYKVNGGYRDGFHN